jgi:hypothetical protein
MLNNADLNDLIHNQFRKKKQAVHINYAAESFNYVVIVAIMLLRFK